MVHKEATRNNLINVMGLRFRRESSALHLRGLRFRNFVFLVFAWKMKHRLYRRKNVVGLVGTCMNMMYIWLVPRAGKVKGILCSDWLPKRARWAYLARSGLPARDCTLGIARSELPALFPQSINLWCNLLAI